MSESDRAADSALEVDLALDAAVLACSAPADLPPAPCEQKAGTDDGTGMRVLVVDDDCDSAETLAALLRTRGHQSAYLCSGRDVMAAVIEQRPDVVLMDIGLPDVDGYEVARRLRVEPRSRDTVLLALTGYGTVEDRARALQAGFCGHLVKPVDLKALERLMRCVARRR